jgi:hypothetical protein
MPIWIAKVDPSALLVSTQRIKIQNLGVPGIAAAPGRGKAAQQLPDPPPSAPNGREGHHLQPPSGYVEQLLGSVGDLTPRLKAGNIQRFGYRDVALDACAVCRSAESLNPVC